MKIVYLLQDAVQIWGGVKTVLEEANLLTDRGHEITIVALSPPPAWIALRCRFITVTTFDSTTIPSADLIVGTFYSTIAGAVNCGRGIPVHYCQGYELDYANAEEHRERVHDAYRLPAEKITIAPHLTRRLREIYGIEAHEIIYWANTPNLYPIPLRDHPQPVRIGLVGPGQVGWKDIRTGLRAIDLLWRAGINLICVRISNTEPADYERDLPFPTEWHCRVSPDQMGDLYRSFDLFLGTSRGNEEGFFMPAVEALTCGIPTVLTDIPCFRGYGTGNYALFVPPQDPVAMAKVAGELICSGEKREMVRDEAIRTAQQFRPDHHIYELEHCFERIIAANRI